MKENKKQLADGVYIITENNQTIPFNFPLCLTERVEYIGLVQGSHSIVISLYDVSGDEITLTIKNTEMLKKIGLNHDIQLKEGEYIPTLAELYLICLNKKVINEAIDFVGGQKLKGWYLSSTEYSATYACGLSLNDGNVHLITNDTTMYKVRVIKQFI